MRRSIISSPSLDPPEKWLHDDHEHGNLESRFYTGVRLTDVMMISEVRPYYRPGRAF